MERVVGSFQTKDGYELFECSINKSPDVGFCVFKDHREGGRFSFEAVGKPVVILDPMVYDNILIKCDVLVVLADMVAKKGLVVLNAKRVVVLYDESHEEGSYKVIGQFKAVKVVSDILQSIREQMKSALKEEDADLMWEQFKDIALMTQEPKIASGERDWTPSPTSHPALELFGVEEG